MLSNTVWLGLASAGTLFQGATAAIIGTRDTAQNITIQPLNASWKPPGPPLKDAADLIPKVINGENWGCKCLPNELCWPNQQSWNTLNTTVGGRLAVHIPPGAVCHNTFSGPFGDVSTYDAAACAETTANWADEQWTVQKPAAALWTYFTNDTCRPTSDPASPCTLGFYGVYVLTATTREHIKAGIDFARQNNIRLIVRNTGHDFLGRSTGYGSLIINTHSFKNIEWIDKFTGPGSYKGSAAKLGTGVQAFEILAAGHARNPPMMVVTGECPTVGIAGGFVQGGGHGPYTPFKGFSADNVLEFEVVTANGQFVTANERENPDLFWALKGGGPGAYAVILSVTMKSFPDLPASGAILYLNDTHTPSPDVFWNATSKFHSYSNHFVDNGLYVYFELFFMTLHVRPFVAINQTQAQLQAILQPLLNDLDAMGVGYEFSISSFPTFYELYTDMFEPEAAGNSALTGGWLFTHEDVAERNDEIIEAFKTVALPMPNNIGIMIGHMFHLGLNNPVANSATHESWRNSSDFIIATIPLPDGATLADKAELQNVLANTMDAALRSASTSGATYVNEADPYQEDWGSRFWGSAYPELQVIRKKWDPLGIFYAIATPGTEDWEVLEEGTRLCKKL